MTALATDTVIGVVGAGAMGSGIAQVAALAGHPVLLVDARNGAAAEAVEQIHQRLAASVAKGRLDGGAAHVAQARLRAVTGLADLAPAGLVVEAIVEELGAKRSLLAELERIVAGSALLASNTSSLSITAIAAALREPARFAGMHFFNPAPVMELVEIVSGLATAPQTAETLAATAAAWGKHPVRCRNSPGFIVNRVARPFYLEALRMAQEHVADPATIDALVREAGGFRMGPFELMDLIGNDVSLAVTRSLFEASGYDARYRPSPLQRELVDAGWLGRKTGRGWFGYEPRVARPQPRTAAPAPAPQLVRASGDGGGLLPLLDRMRSAGLTVAHPVEGPPGLRCDETLARPADAPAAAAVLIDLALDYASCMRLAVATDRAALPAPVVGALQACGIAVTPVPARPGLVLARLLAMIVNEATDMVDQGAASAADLDLAMRKGVNYPRGPLEWAACLPATLLPTILDQLWAASRDSRYARAVGLAE